MSSCRFDLSRRRSTTFSPNRVGQTETRKSISLPRPSFSLMRPSCGRRRSADVELAHDLEARDDGVLQLDGRLHHLVEHAVDAEADPEVLLVGLDVDVGGALLDGVEQDEVHQLHDRCFPGALLQVDHVAVALVVVDDRDLRVVEALHEVLVRGPLLGVVALDGLLDGRLGGDHRLDVVAGVELDVVDGEDVRRIAHGDDERAAGAVHRHHLVLLGDGLGDELDDLGVDVEVLQVDGGHAVLLGEEAGEVALGDGALLHQQGADARAGLALLLLGLLELLQRDEVLANEELTEASGHLGGWAFSEGERRELRPSATVATPRETGQGRPGAKTPDIRR